MTNVQRSSATGYSDLRAWRKSKLIVGLTQPNSKNCFLISLVYRSFELLSTLRVDDDITNANCTKRLPTCLNQSHLCAVMISSCVYPIHFKSHSLASARPSHILPHRLSLSLVLSGHTPSLHPPQAGPLRAAHSHLCCRFLVLQHLRLQNL